MAAPFDTALLLDVIASELGFIQTIQTLTAVVSQTAGTLAAPDSAAPGDGHAVLIELLFPFAGTRGGRFDYYAIGRRLGRRRIEGGVLSFDVLSIQ